ncbi:MAG: Gfo/Idh/MocA family oxidoreductase [Planctomycetes bacterium]|nr:Gfo/Idh/MocA family oxidoreductase [Planctomycetota bacterium]
MNDSPSFALIGAAGYVAPRHLRAIRDVGGVLRAACDPHDSVGVLDSYFPEARFFTEFERFDRHLERLRRERPDERVRYVSVCSPNYLHDAHVRLAMRLHADAVCEKPLVINPWNLDQLEALEAEHAQRIYTVMQLRQHPALLALRARIQAGDRPRQVELTYVTQRGKWYEVSWKGDAAKSGGLVLNLGVHFFDLLTWLFGEVEACEVYRRDADCAAGWLVCGGVEVRWLLSTRGEDVPAAARAAGRRAYRALLLDGEEVEFSSGFEDLHTRVYADVLEGRGLRIGDARPSIELVYRIRHDALTAPTARARAHPLLAEDA